ncbi:Negative elongation factor C/D [Entomortierella chlamydospora]|uniref:Negative elongation factor C/D n=1 Tax=Entomortierella chlamydospora TaxID=101097 RepID=A0A9P6N4F5_9FUNG|nr:Negative elongation factor C/D [Entomortierella chlamydospora]
MATRNNAGGNSETSGVSSNVDMMMQSFQAPDSILEPKIFETIAAFIKEGGQPLLLVNALSNSYVGMPEMCNLMSGWARDFDLDPVEIMQEVLKEQLMERFDPESVDKDFMTGSGTPDWLLVMIQHPFWRSVIYELSEKHQKCALLNFAIQRISDAGYQGEIASVATASTFVNVFSGVLLDSLDKLREEDDVGLLDRLPDLVAATRIYSEDVIGGSIFDGSKCNFRYTSIPAYTSENPPSTYFLRDPDFFEIMLSSIFVPSFKGGMVKQDHKEKYLWLMAYAASVHEENDMITDKSEVQPTYEALSALEDTLSKRTAGTDLTPILGNLLVAIETPVASMALLYWIQFVIKETSYIETYFRSHEVPVPLLLIEEMAYKHPLQQAAVFATLVDFFEAPLELNPEIMMTYRKSILDRMIYLMQLNYVMPVLDYIQLRARKMDQSLSMHFVKKVLEMVRGPYSRKFIEGMGQMTQEIVEVIKKTDAEPIVRAWIDEVVAQSSDLEIQTPPALPTSATSHESGTGPSSSGDSGLATIQEVKRRLDEPRR